MKLFIFCTFVAFIVCLGNFYCNFITRTSFLSKFLFFFVFYYIWFSNVKTNNNSEINGFPWNSSILNASRWSEEFRIRISIDWIIIWIRVNSLEWKHDVKIKDMKILWGEKTSIEFPYFANCLISFIRETFLIEFWENIGWKIKGFRNNGSLK